MPRYIDEKDVYALVEPRGIAKVHCSQIDELPRADVVPKSEYDAVVSAIDNSTKEFLKLHDAYQNQKTEVDILKSTITQKEDEAYTKGYEDAKKKEDMVEVVRCKNCRHWDKDNIKIYTYSSDDSTPAEFAECTYWSCWSTCHSTRYNDYCSLAEKE